MSKTLTLSAAERTTSPSGSPKPDLQAYRHFSESLQEEIPCGQVILLTTLPRGGLQIVQPQRVSEPFLKSYGREWQAEDDAAWQAIRTGKPARGKASSRYVSTFLHSFDFDYVVAAPVKDPVMDGYIGAVELHRNAEAGEFTAAELTVLDKAVKSFEAALLANRKVRSRIDPVEWQHHPSSRVFILDGRGSVLLFKNEFEQLDENLRYQMIQEARRRTADVNGEFVHMDRLTLPDSFGDIWTMNAAVYRTYTALHDGPVVFFCLIPTCPEWGQLRPADFIADAEIARLMPALKFMQAEYHRGPTLTEIAKTVHLSPFHFHRRFTELLGLTPKHFLLECQIFDAKNELLSGEKELSKIAADCGFAHQSHFTSRFKQATGLTPTRWRRMVYGRQA
jgi:AraC-like DNA-binding protein